MPQMSDFWGVEDSARGTLNQNEPLPEVVVVTLSLLYKKLYPQ
jgi:hypothetical protein